MHDGQDGTKAITHARKRQNTTVEDFIYSAYDFAKYAWGKTSPTDLQADERIEAHESVHPFCEAIRWRKYYFAGSTRIAMRKDGVLSFLLSDHPSTTLRTGLGSTSITTNASGALVSELRYREASLWDNPWGETRYSFETTPTSYKYTGQREESSFGLYFYNARWPRSAPEGV